MVQSRSLMEKSIRSAIQRHLRGWSPYPHVRVVDTQEGHRVQWSQVQNILDPSQRIIVDTVGTPAKRNFSIVGIQGKRHWKKTDASIMGNDPYLLALQPWTFAAVPESLAALSSSECEEVLAHLQESWKKNAGADKLLRMINAQTFPPSVALHTYLDVLAAASTLESLHEPTLYTEPLARILLGHAMRSNREAWACKLGYPPGKWSDMSIVAWRHDSGWRMAIIPQDNPILFSYYDWQKTSTCLVFQDRLPVDSPDDTKASRGSFERYTRHSHFNEALLQKHWHQLDALCSINPTSIEPDAVWTRPIAAAFKKGLLTSSSISPEYYSFLRAFEEQGFHYLSGRAATPEGLALAACMMIGRSLDEPPKNIDDFQNRFAVWARALDMVKQKEAFVVDSSVFEDFHP